MEQIKRKYTALELWERNLERLIEEKKHDLLVQINRMIEELDRAKQRVLGDETLNPFGVIQTLAQFENISGEYRSLKDQMKEFLDAKIYDTEITLKDH